MSSEQYERVGELYHAAMELEPEARPDFLAAAARPRSRRIPVALSISPPASARARLQSMKPAPVRSRNAFTSWAENSAMRVWCSFVVMGPGCPSRRDAASGSRLRLLGLFGGLPRELGRDLIG